MAKRTRRQPLCPQCESNNILSIETVLVSHPLVGFVDGEPVYQESGEAEVCWDTQTPVRSAEGAYRLQCGDCDHAFDYHPDGADPAAAAAAAAAPAAEPAPVTRRWMIAYQQTPLAYNPERLMEVEAESDLDALATAVRALAGRGCNVAATHDQARPLTDAQLAAIRDAARAAGADGGSPVLLSRVVPVIRQAPGRLVSPF